MLDNITISEHLMWRTEIVTLNSRLSAIQKEIKSIADKKLLLEEEAAKLSRQLNILRMNNLEANGVIETDLDREFPGQVSLF